jgi:hypothetical protein
MPPVGIGRRGIALPDADDRIRHRIVQLPDMDDSIVKLLRERSIEQPWATATTPVRRTGTWKKLTRPSMPVEFTGG